VLLVSLLLVSLMLASASVGLAQTTAATPAAPKASTEILGSGFQRDSDQPVNIAADSLDVAQDAKTATFTGNVEIIQGELRLKAAVVVVHYRSKDEAAAPAAKKPATGTATGSGSNASEISRLEAKTDVFLSSPTQTAQGDWADYDVVKGEVTMGGKVVLTRGKNVLKGTALALDLNTGRSRLTAEAGQGGRVQGLFIPKKREKATTP
jgi:lipopolysaccharide export system protein LptA